MIGRSGSATVRSVTSSNVRFREGVSGWNRPIAFSPTGGESAEQNGLQCCRCYRDEFAAIKRE